MESSRTPRTGKVFVDSSVLFAAALSPTGAGWELMRRALRAELQLFASPLVLQEVERNLSRKASQGLSVFHPIRATVPLALVTPDQSLVAEAASVVALKDAPIVAGAIASRSEAIATYDRKHLLKAKATIENIFSIAVKLPDDILKWLTS